MKLSLTQWQAFVTLADQLHFTRAAERLHITQPTLSATIHQIEEHVGGRLFDRDTRKVRLTTLGLECLEMAVRVLSEASRAESAIQDLVSVRRGTVRFSALPVLYPSFLSKALIEYRLAYPAIEMQLTDLGASEALEHLHRNLIDLAVLTQANADPELECVPVGATVIAALLLKDHPLAKTKTIQWKHLVSEPIVLLNARSLMGAVVDQMLTEASMRLVATHQVDQLVTAVGLVRSGFGIGVMSSNSARLMAVDGLVMREIVGPHITRPLVLAHHHRRELSPAATRLKEVILRHCAIHS